MTRFHTYFCLCGFFLTSLTVSAQKVGVVLSGGGATGLAHIGVLMALEEAQIPIDYITGTSAGALVGAMYACGYSPEQIKGYVLSDDFLKMATGELPVEKRFLLRTVQDDPSMLNIPFSIDSSFRRSLPTNVITPTFLDYEMLRVFGATGMAVGYDFDQLFVPYRCVASDIANKKSAVFSSGHLNAAVRASMTYPFYINPISIDGQLMFDGGLYNNFPSDVMYNNFDADFLIGSNVSSNAAPPREDDLVSQLQNLLVTASSFTLPCEEGIMINPNVPVGTFDFNKAEEAILIGYRSAQLQLDSIRMFVKDSVPPALLAERRREFLGQLKPLIIHEVEARSSDGKKFGFVERSIVKDSLVQPIDFETFTKRYFRTYATPQIRYLYPKLEINPDSTLKVSVDVTKQKPFVFHAGGHFSSRPVNTGYIGLSYLDIGDAAMSLRAESFFGKFYGSAHVIADFDIPSVYPIRVSPYFTMNRWDYFRSFATFFEEVRPSFLVQNEMYYGVKFSFPLANSVKTDLDFRAFNLNDSYYQTENFTNLDTADVTNFDGQTAVWRLEHNALNRKQWASSGTFYKLQVRYVQGREQSVSGSTADEVYDIRRLHRWISVSGEGQYFPLSRGFFKLGVYGKGVFNSQSLFANYTATVLTTTEFSPLPDVRTFFMEEYRAPQYVGAGFNLIFSLSNQIDFRIDPYFFQPFRQIVRYDNGSFGWDDLFTRGTFMGAASLVYHSPIGPLRLTTNYFPNQSRPFITQLSFGYVLFNQRAIR